jgi:hypothetical protein
VDRILSNQGVAAVRACVDNNDRTILTGSGLLDLAMVEKSEIVSDVSEGTPVKCAKGVVYPSPEPIQRAAPGARTALYIRTSPTRTDLEKVRSSDVRNLVCVLTKLWKGPRDPECTVLR